MAHERGLDRFLGWRQVRDLTGLGRTTAWRMRQAGDFPDPVPISPGRVAWRERDIAAWNESRGPEIPTRRPRAVSPAANPARAHDPRVIAAPRADKPADSAATANVRPEPRRRSRPAIAEGQLGFDF